MRAHSEQGFHDAANNTNGKTGEQSHSTGYESVRVNLAIHTFGKAVHL